MQILNHIHKAKPKYHDHDYVSIYSCYGAETITKSLSDVEPVFDAKIFFIISL